MEWKIQRGRIKDTKNYMNELKNWTKDPKLAWKNLEELRLAVVAATAWTVCLQSRGRNRSMKTGRGQLC